MGGGFFFEVESVGICERVGAMPSVEWAAAGGPSLLRRCKVFVMAEMGHQ